VRRKAVREHRTSLPVLRRTGAEDRGAKALPHSLLAFLARFVSNAHPVHRKIALAILVCCLAGSVPAQNRGSDIQLTKISRDLVLPPDFNYTGAEKLRESHDRWLKVEVQFAAAPEFTDEVIFKYYILIGGKILTGEVTHVNVLAGRELYSCMYVPPHALAYVLGNRPPNTTSVENVAVQVLQKGEVKDELSMARARPQWFTSLPALPGFVLNKSETPFAPLFWGYYEQIKPVGH